MYSIGEAWSVVKSLLLVNWDKKNHCRLLESCTSRSPSWADLFWSDMATQQTRTSRTLIHPCPWELPWLSGYVSKVSQRGYFLDLLNMQNWITSQYEFVSLIKKWLEILVDMLFLHTLLLYLFHFSWQFSQLRASPHPCPTLCSVSTRSGVRRIPW